MEEAKNTLKKSKFDTKTIVGVGILTALVVVLQFVSMGLLRFSTFSITLTLIPIVVGAALFGWKWGAWLGTVFGAAVLLTGDAAAFLALNIPGTIITVLVKGAAAGRCAGLAYKLVEKKSEIAAVFVASVVAPVVNTGIFIAGCYIFFFDSIAAGAAEANYGVLPFILIFYVGTNFFIGLGTNLILNPAAVAIIKQGKKSFKTV